ncbi:hypothetical protein ESCO_002275 [Escovopsis weberi]|uniref:Aminodeoxychorismate lyase n=1 Tax=Escovopsis weberi TaxID=150374 RepID=A0A0M8N2B3_ESCWE|nr:hypothetical protein ESCO_002275 [Escovopsis weberi]
MADQDGFSLFTSIRYDPILLHDGSDPCSAFYMLEYHRDRILRAATHFQWEQAIRSLSGPEGLSRLAASAEAALGEPRLGGGGDDTQRRLRIIVDRHGSISVETHATAPVARENLLPARLPAPGAAPAAGEARVLPRPWAVVPDDIGTAPCEHTHYKTTRRGLYDSARRRMAIARADEREVLLVHRADGTVMEGSITTPYFWRDGRWVTPPVPREFSPSGGGGGQDGTTRRGIAVEQPVRADSLQHGEECWISNGVRGFIAGRVCLE